MSERSGILLIYALIVLGLAVLITAEVKESNKQMRIRFGVEKITGTENVGEIFPEFTK